MPSIFFRLQIMVGFFRLFDFNTIVLIVYFSLNQALGLISKTSYNELKSYTNPPIQFILVGNCICVLYTIKPSFDNFKKILAQSTFLDSLKTYDKDNVSSQKIDQLSKYINNPDFNQESMKKFPNALITLFNWIMAFYQYAKVVFEIFEENSNL
jgi:dynein heavy chain